MVDQSIRQPTLKSPNSFMFWPVAGRCRNHPPSQDWRPTRQETRSAPALHVQGAQEGDSDPPTVRFADLARSQRDQAQHGDLQDRRDPSAQVSARSAGGDVDAFLVSGAGLVERLGARTRVSSQLSALKANGHPGDQTTGKKPFE